MSTQFRLPCPAVPSRLKRAGPIAAALMAALVLVPTSSAGSYTDPAGDGGKAGDITSVTVAGDKGTGQLLFKITGTNIASSEQAPLFLDIDSDANPTTGTFSTTGRITCSSSTAEVTPSLAGAAPIGSTHRA